MARSTNSPTNQSDTGALDVLITQRSRVQIPPPQLTFLSENQASFERFAGRDPRSARIGVGLGFRVFLSGVESRSVESWNRIRGTSAADAIRPSSFWLATFNLAGTPGT